MRLSNVAVEGERLVRFLSLTKCLSKFHFEKNKLGLFWICLAFLSLLAVPTRGNTATCTLWVDNIYGHDENPGTLSLPTQTIEKAINLWRESDKSCALILQLSPGNYLEKTWNISDMDLCIMKCEECPPFEYMQTSVTVSTAKMIFVVYSNMTFKNIDFSSTEVLSYEFLEAFQSNMTLINISASNFVTHSTIIRSTYGSLSVFNSRFENNLLLPTTFQALSTIVSVQSTLELDSILCQYNTILRQSYISHYGGPCIYSSSDFSMKNSIIRLNEAKFGYSIENVTVSLLCGAVTIEPIVLRPHTIIISDSIFEGNFLPLYDTVSRWETHGGALSILASDLTSISLMNLTFSNNSAFYGGAVAIWSRWASKTSNVIVNCRFFNNIGLAGSALFIQYPASTWKITDSLFSGNLISWKALDRPVQVERTGTLYLVLNGRTILSDCIFDSNKIENYDNVVDFIPIDGLVLYLKTGIEIFGCQFKNHDTPFDVPLIIHNWPGTFFGCTIDSNLFENNRGLIMSFLPGDQAIFAEEVPMNSMSTVAIQNTSNFYYLFSRLQITGNVFHISPSQRYSPLTIATPLKVFLSNNTFYEIPSDASPPPIDQRVHLITVTQYPKSFTFANQDVPFMGHFRGISVMKIPEFTLQNSSWRLPFQLAEVGSVNFNKVAFFNMSTTAIHLVNSASSYITDATFDSISSVDNSAALKITSATLVISNSTFSNCAGLIGGVIKTDSYLRVRQSVFLSNKAISLAGTIWTNALLKIENSNFTANVAPQAGAIFSASGLVTVSGSRFIKNYARKSGGAIWALERLRIDASTFIENRADAYAGAISMGSDATLRVLNTAFIGNTARNKGLNKKDEASQSHNAQSLSTESMDALQVRGGSGGSIWMPMGRRLFLNGCSFLRDEATVGSSIYLQGIPREFSVTDSSFSSPTSTSNVGGSITIYPAPASYCDSERHTKYAKKIQNCTFTATSQKHGGALYLRPCESDTPETYIPTIHMSQCVFNECVTMKPLVYIEGPLGKYLNWTRSFIDCEADLLQFQLTGKLNNSTLNENFPSGCIDCRVPEGPLKVTSNIATAHTLNTTQIWKISPQIIPISLTGIYQSTYLDSENSAITLSTSHPEIFGIFATVYLGDVSLPKSLRVSLNASSAFYHESIYVGSSLERETEYNARQVPLFESGYSIFIHLTSLPLLPWYPLVSDMTIDVTLAGCDIGSGIRPHPVLANTFICAPCPVGSYNIAPSANCYLCNDPKSPVTKVSCFGSTITSERGHFVSTSKNRIWTYDCNYKYCDGTSNGTQCTDNRQGYLCADCAPGMKESLMFALCGSCPHSWGDSVASYSFIAVAIILLVLIAIGAHLAINTNLPLSLTGLLSAQQLLLYPRQYVSTMLPHGLPASLVHWACIAPSSAMTRATIFAPTISAVLPIVCAVVAAIFVLIIVVVKKVACKKRDTDSEPTITESSQILKTSQSVDRLEFVTEKEARTPFQQILLTTWVFGLLTLAPLLQTIIEFSACEETLNGELWRVAPSVHCSDTGFKQRRLLFMLIGIPWIIFYIFSTGVLLTIGKLGSLGVIFQFRTHFKKKYLAVVWLASLIFANLLVGMVTSLSYWKDDIAPIMPMAMMIPVANFVFLQPMVKSFFDSFLMIVSFATASIALIPWSRSSMAHPNTNPVNDAVQLYCTLGLMIFWTVPLFFSENLINRLSK